MLLQQIHEAIQEVTPHHFLVKMGEIYRVAKHNYNQIELTDEVAVNRVTRMWVNNGRIHSSVDTQQQNVKMSDGFEVMSPRDALSIYQLQRGAMKHLAADAGESPNYIRQINDIDS